MIIRAPRPQSNFYILDKRIAEDKRLSWAARGMLIYLLGKPDHWQVSTASLINQTSDSRISSGRDAVRALLTELIDTGYITRTLVRGEDGKVERYDYSVSECPQSAPEPEEPETDNPGPVQTPQVSIEYKQGMSKNTPLPPKGDEGAFTKFWDAYPKKKSKGQAEKAFAKIKNVQAVLPRILSSIEQAKQTRDWEKSEGQFIPYPATWLNARGWEDFEEQESQWFVKAGFTNMYEAENAGCTEKTAYLWKDRVRTPPQYGYEQKGDN